jgi:hypothetical protein
MNISSLINHRRPTALLALAALLWAAPALYAQEQKPIQLPKPEIIAGMPLMQALARRQTTRAFLDKPLPPQPFRICCGRPLASIGRAT